MSPVSSKYLQGNERETMVVVHSRTTASKLSPCLLCSPNNAKPWLLLGHSLNEHHYHRYLNTASIVFKLSIVFEPARHCARHLTMTYL